MRRCSKSTRRTVTNRWIASTFTGNPQRFTGTIPKSTTCRRASLTATATPYGAAYQAPGAAVCGKARRSAGMSRRTCAFRASTWTAKRACTTILSATITRQAGVTPRWTRRAAWWIKPILICAQSNKLDRPAGISRGMG